MEMPTAVNFVVQLARLHLKESKHFDSFFFGKKELLKGLQEAGEANSETLFNSLALNYLM